MSKTVFKKVDYDLNGLIKSISMGEIGLPNIQRPFVWNNAKVRDLFDSMYKGYPVGYLLFWQNGVEDEERTIGSDHKQKHASLVIVDGQQRLTSLYAVVKNIPVLRENYKTETIKIAFNPMEERFEVVDAAINRDKSFIPDISILWNEESKITRIIRDYTDNIKTVRELTDEEENRIEDNILKLQGLISYPLTALELKSDVDEEAVSDVFVRINSKGTPLNQADFILTLMSVFWDDGRAELEQFCRDAKHPSKDHASPYNHFIEPSPDQLLRVCVGVAFKRARLKYVYSILRGKDLETEKFSVERREQQFEELKKAQERVLNLQYWHDFMRCIQMAGFRSDKMISSQNNLIFAYILYLIGRTEYQVSEQELRRAISRWFFMGALTGRFAKSPESSMEYDLARLRPIKKSSDFIQSLNKICDIELTKDYWEMTLPNQLATSSSRSPSLFAYQAALILLDAPVLFSKMKFATLCDPAIQAKRAPVEKHHLFPKGYLKTKGINQTIDYNQIANYAFVEWGDNNDISAKAPSEYFPEYKNQYSRKQLEEMYYYHALPENWENMNYNQFLERRRELIAQVIADGYATLITKTTEQETESDMLDLYEKIMNGESQEIEFKSTLRTNLHTNSKDPRMEFTVLRTIAGFLNTNGGQLIIGISDDSEPVGLEVDGFENEDKMTLHFVNIIKSRIDVLAMKDIHMHFDDYKGSRVMVVRCSSSKTPVFVKDDNTEKFFIRTGPSTTELTPSQTQSYIKQRF